MPSAADGASRPVPKGRLLFCLCIEVRETRSRNRIHARLRARTSRLPRVSRPQGWPLPQAGVPSLAPQRVAVGCRDTVLWSVADSAICHKRLARGHPAQQGTRAGPWQQTEALSRGQALLAEAATAACLEAPQPLRPLLLSALSHLQLGRSAQCQAVPGSGVGSVAQWVSSCGRQRCDRLSGVGDSGLAGWQRCSQALNGGDRAVMGPLRAFWGG